jgi:dynein heavy chain
MPKDELDMIINDIRPVMKAALPGVTDTWDNLYSFFLNRVRDNLHVVLCFSPVGNKFSTRAQQFPGLINGCTIDWFLPWPEEALTSGKVPKALSVPADGCVQWHLAAALVTACSCRPQR